MVDTSSITPNVTFLARTGDLSSNEWLTLRKAGVGGSEVAALFGKSNYASPLSLYLDKLSDHVEDDMEENEYIEWGKTLEPIIREKFPAKFKKVTDVDIFVDEFPFMMRSNEHEFMLANIDGLVVPQQDYRFKLQIGENEWEEYFIPAGQVGGFESKTGSGFTAKNWKDNSLPDGYFLQTQHYMAVTGLQYFFVVALIDKTMLWRYVPRDDELISIIIEAERRFWHENVLKKNPPAPIGKDTDTQALKELYPHEVTDRSVDLSSMLNKRFRYKELAEEIKVLQTEQDIIKQEFMAAMGDAEVAFVGDKKVTWKMQKGSTYTVTREPQRVLRIG